MAFRQTVEDANANNDCDENEEIERLNNSRITKTIKRRDNESHKRRERVLRDCMSDTENASERRKQLGWFLGNFKPRNSKIRLHLIERNRSKWASWCNDLNWSYDRRNEYCRKRNSTMTPCHNN